MSFGCWFTVNSVFHLWLCSWWPTNSSYVTPISFLTQTPLLWTSPPHPYVFYCHGRLAYLSSLFFSPRFSYGGEHFAVILTLTLSSHVWHRSCLVCAGWFVEPGRRRLFWLVVLIRVRCKNPMWTLGVCPCPFPGHLSLWCILALGNIDLNALCFDLNQLLPV